MTRFVILIPAGAVTGGPEALHQLSDSLLAQGFDANVWYVTGRDALRLEGIAGKRQSLSGGRIRFRPVPSVPPEYAHYAVRQCEGDWVVDREIVFVIPEIFVHWVGVFTGTRTLVWWLSVDNAFGSLAKVNLNILRQSGVFHLAQSRYAAGFIRSLGLGFSGMLTDYTPRPDEKSRKGTSEQAPCVAINGNLAKVRVDPGALKSTIETGTGMKAHVIAGLARTEVYDLLQTSSVYVDLGSFPGKDRMPREALIRDCIPLLKRAGAAASGDFGLPDELLIDREDDSVGIAKLCGRVARDRLSYLRLLQPTSLAVRHEREVFDVQVRALAGIG